MSKKQEASFGFKNVSFDKKRSLVNDVFSSVASKYDIMNDTMSMGIHRIWKKALLKEVTNLKGDILDMASGTGDIALALHKKAKERGIENPNITASDANQDMLDVGRSRAIDEGILDIKYQTTFAEKTPFKANSFDYYIVCFGIRNFTDIEAALEEAQRILRPGGKFICMEFSEVENNLMRKLYDFYSMNVIPLIGKAIAGDGDSYQYLVESIRKFPNQESFKSMIENAGFDKVKYQNFTMGIASIHTGYKPHSEG